MADASELSWCHMILFVVSRVGVGAKPFSWQIESDFQSSPRFNEHNGLCLGSPKTKNSLSTPRGCIRSLDPRWCHMVNQLEHWRFSQCGVSPSAKHSLYNLYTTHEEIHISIRQRGQYREASNILYFSSSLIFSGYNQITTNW